MVYWGEFLEAFRIAECRGSVVAGFFLEGGGG